MDLKKNEVAKIDALATEMSNDILKSLGQEKNPMSIIIEAYISAKLKTLTKYIKDGIDY